MKLRQDALRAYVGGAPLALALERALECSLYDGQSMARPVLDLGCGDGLFAWILFAEPVDLGIDLDPREIRRAARLGAHTELVCCPGAEVPRPDGSFRTVLSNSVLEHIPELQPVLREAFRLLQPGGLFIASVPTDRFERYTLASTLLEALRLPVLAARFRQGYNRFWAHHHALPEEEWRARFAESGFEIVAMRGYGSRRSCLLNDALVPLGLPALLAKRLLHRWTLLPPLRRAFIAPLAAFLRTPPEADVDLKDGGLLFITARKPLP